MKIIEKGQNIQNNEVIGNYFMFDSIDTIVDIKSIIYNLQKTYGDVNNIIIKTVEGNDVTYFKKFVSLEDFLSNFNSNDYEKTNLYEAHSEKLTFIVDKAAKRLDSYKTEPVKWSDFPITYYRFENGIFGKYVSDECGYYILDKDGKWQFDGYIGRMVNNGEIDYEELIEKRR